jgi:formamidase
MAETIIKIDLNKSAYDNDKIHNRWHPDIPMVATVKPGDLLEVDILDIGTFKESQWGFNGFFSKKNGGGFLTEHFPEA